MVKRQLQWALTIFVGIIVIVGGGSMLVRHVIGPHVQRLPFVSNRDVVPFHENFGFDPEIPIMVYGYALLQESDAPPPFVEYESQVVYLPVAFLAYHYDRFLFWDEYAQVLTITTHNEMLVFHPGQVQFYLNGFPQYMTNPILMVNGNLFMPACLAEGLYPLTVYHNTENNIVIIENINTQHTRAELTSRTDIRYGPDNRSPIAARAASGSRITVFEESENGDFTRVRNEDGIVGWVTTSSVGASHIGVDEVIERETLLDGFVNYAIRRTALWPTGRTVIMAWDNISEPAANNTRMQSPIYESINVIAPTWLRLDSVDAGVASIGTQEYTAWAHEQGVQVWPTFEIAGGQTRAFLTNRAARQRVINQLANFVDELNLDGINIDFSPASPAEGPYFVQFLRELSLRLGMRSVVLSVNIAAQETAFYSRELLRYTVDFVFVLALDEHGHDAQYSGPVASLPFVAESVNNMLAYIPQEQLILGLPFYNRIWREVIGDNTQETRQVQHFGTAYTREWFEYNNAVWEWLPEVGSYYGRFAAHEGDDIVYYRVWLECERSMSEKLQVVLDNNLRGVALWNRNFRHNEELWEVMGQHYRR
ncbi:MAG: glycosyl hydrolase family 18 protein [Defluviitaleaceae bacterium]|nr:glycosyl hydrolase family 18 protein [Defluviitaleaceae bacterium]